MLVAQKVYVSEELNICRVLSTRKTLCIDFAPIIAICVMVTKT